MATYEVESGDVGAHAKTLSAATVDTVTFAADVEIVEIVSDGASAMYVTADGSAPTVAGANTWLLPAGAPSTRTLRTVLSNGATVKLISAGTPTYSVSRAV